jgi:acyl carrier protein
MADTNKGIAARSNRAVAREQNEGLMHAEAIREQLRRFIVKSFPLARKRNVRMDDPLLEDGIIDSLGVLDLVGYIEAEFRVEVADEDLLPVNFQTIVSLTSFVQRKLIASSRMHHDGNGTSSPF